MSTDGNPARSVRREDAFDVAAVTGWLARHGAEPFRSRVAGEPEVWQYPGGASNLTYLMRWPGAGAGAGAGESLELILRRPPAGAKARSAHDMGREFRIQSALAPVFAYLPTMVGFCDDPAVIGSDFYVMEKVDGTILRRDLTLDLTPDQVGTLCGNVLDVLCALHAVDVEAVPELTALNRGPGYVARQVAGWTDRLARAATDDLGDWGPVTAWLAEHRPDDVARVMIHNDYRFDNLVLAPDDPLRVVAVLDWEMATVGDPLMDLGGMLAYWIQPEDDDFFQSLRRQPTTAPGMWTRAEVVEQYAARTGISVTTRQWLFYEVFGLFRLAVIAQQIWYRYALGQTTNEAYAPFGPMVGHLEQRCRRLLGLPARPAGRAPRQG